MRNALKRGLGSCIRVVALFGLMMAGLGLVAGSAVASNGGVAKDLCHHLNVEVDGEKVSVERHWHLPPHEADGKKRVRGGPCITRGDKTYRLTKHDLCAETRIDMVEAEGRYGSDYKRLAEAFKACIIDLDAPAPGPEKGG